MTIDKKTIIIIVLCVALAIVSWVDFVPTAAMYDDTLIKVQLKKLDSANAVLRNEIEEEHKKNALYVGKIDSLSKLEPIIITKYVDRYKKIDSASATTISNEFSVIFANAGIRQK